MGFKRRATTTAKLPISEGAKEELKILFLTDIVTCKEKYNVPESLILNLDQTPSKLIKTSRYTFAKGGSKDIPLAGSSDKRTITATFVISLSGNFLPIQLIYGGKTDRSIPRVKFPPSFSLSANPKHYSYTKEAIKVTNDVVIPYIKRERARLRLDENQTAILIMDVFRGQMTNKAISLLKENNIILIRVPANMTYISTLRPNCQSGGKKFMRDRFSQCNLLV